MLWPLTSTVAPAGFKFVVGKLFWFHWLFPHHQHFRLLPKFLKRHAEDPRKAFFQFIILEPTVNQKIYGRYRLAHALGNLRLSELFFFQSALDFIWRHVVNSFSKSFSKSYAV